MHRSHARGSHAAMSHCPKTTLLPFHHGLTKRKYRMLFSSQRGRRPGQKGPAKELIDAVVPMKRRNPTWGCPRIAQQITLAFGLDLNKDMVRRIVGKHYRLESGSGSPSWLTFLGQAKDSLWGSAAKISEWVRELPAT
jgi:putative transposase